MDFIGKQPGKKTATSNGINTIRGNAFRNPGKIALRTERLSVTYAQLWQRVIQLSNAVIDRGMTKNDSMITYMANCPQYAEIMLTSQMTGSPLTLGNYRLTGDEIAYQINDSGAAMVFVQADFLPVILKIKNQLAGVKHIIVIGDSPDKNIKGYEDFLSAGSKVEPSLDVLSEDMSMLFYTSGTTGKPKGAARTMYSNYNMAVSTLITLSLRSDDMMLVVAPMYAAATSGYLLSTLMAGGTLFIVPAFVPEETLKLIDKYRPTFIFMVPVMYDWLLSFPPETLAKYDLSSVRVVTSCGAPMHTSIFQKMKNNFKTDYIYNMLGCSELGFVSIISADEWLEQGKANSIGKPTFDVEMKIVSEKGETMAAGEVGLLYCRTPQNFDGYWHNETGTQEAFLDHEWGTVGDMARMDEDGFCYLVDRAKDMIVSGGTNIYPAEVEGVIQQMDGIADAGVIGVPDEKWGELVKAVVVLKNGFTVTEDEIISFCKEKLAGFKVPKSVDYIDIIPRNAVGKMLKKDLRKKYWEGRDVFIS